MIVRLEIHFIVNHQTMPKKHELQIQIDKQKFVRKKVENFALKTPGIIE